MFLELAAATWEGGTDEGSVINVINKIAEDYPAVVEEWARHCRPGGRPLPPPKPLSPEQLSAKMMRLCESDLEGSAPAKKYLESRGDDLRTAKRCKVGFCLPTTARKLNAKTEDMLAAGILREGKSIYNPSNGGINVLLCQREPGKRAVETMRRGFPLKRGFYARRLPQYMKEGQHPHMYSRGGNLPWRIDVAAKMAKEGGIEKLFLVESVLDALTVESYIDAAFEGKRWIAVATLGTNGVSDEELVELVVELAPQECVLIPDTDAWRKPDGTHHAPGQEKGRDRAIALENAGVNVRVMALPEGRDPNDMRAPGKLAWDTPTFLRHLGAAGTPLVYRLWGIAQYYELKSPSGRQAFLDVALKVLRSSYKGRELPSELARVLTKVGHFDESERGKIHAKVLEAVLPNPDEAPAARQVKTFIRKWASSLKSKGKSEDEVFGVIKDEIAVVFKD